MQAKGGNKLLELMSLDCVRPPVQVKDREQNVEMDRQIA
jgi:hypothetical protein